MMTNVWNKMIAALVGATMCIPACGDSAETLSRKPAAADPCALAAESAPEASSVQCTTGVSVNGKPSANTEWSHEVNGSFRSNDGNFSLAARWAPNPQLRASSEVRLGVENGMVVLKFPDRSDLKLSLGDNKDELLIERTFPNYDSKTAFCSGIVDFSMTVLARGPTLSESSCDYDETAPNIETGCFPCPDLNRVIRAMPAADDPETAGRVAVLVEQAKAMNAKSNSPYRAQVAVLLGTVLISGLFAYLGKGKTKTSYDEDDNLWGIETAHN